MRSPLSQCHAYLLRHPVPEDDVVVEGRNNKFITGLEYWVMRKLLRNTDGAIAVYAAFVSALVIGSGVLAIDFGKAVVLKAQMQNAADAAAISAALQLNGQAGAQDRATAVARDAVNHGSHISDDGDRFSLALIRFYSDYDPDTDGGTITTNDADSIFVEVVLSSEDVTIVLEPVLALISRATNEVGAFKVDARAVATPAHVVCDNSPLFVCNPNEPGAAGANSDDDLLDPTNKNAGRQLVIKEGAGGNTYAPGNFGLLCPDPDIYGNCGAKAINEALAAEPAGVCYKPVTVETAPGTKLNQVVNGINQRFGLYGNPVPNPKPKPAKDIMGYYKDPDAQDLIDAVKLMGSGQWDFQAYWDTYHPGEDMSAIGANAGDSATWPSRFQVWLYENGEGFYRSGKKTIYPPPADSSELPPGHTWTLIAPAGWNWPEDPDNPGSDYAVIPDSNAPAPTTNMERRVLTIPVLNCESLGVKGSNEYPTLGQFVQVYVSECSCSGGGCTNGTGTPEVCEEGPLSNGDIWAEVIGPLTPQTAFSVGNPNAVMVNVKLVD